MYFDTSGLYECDPRKNTKCKKTNCHMYGGDCHYTTEEQYKMENEIRYYLKAIKEAITAPEVGGEPKPFKPSYIVTAVALPTGAIELAVNTEHIVEKIDYILEAYDEDMLLKTNPKIQMRNVMVV